MKYLVWLLKAAIFFTLFAFALNNQHTITVHFFFGQEWSAPLVLVVLAAFAFGLAVGALGWVPRGLTQRAGAGRATSAANAAGPQPGAPANPPMPPMPPMGPNGI